MPNNLPVTTKRTVEVVRFLLLLGIIGVVLFAAFILIAIQPATSDVAALNQVVHVEAGMNAGSIAQLLKNEGLIDNATVFLILAKVIRAEQHLQAGYYLLSPAMGSLEIIDHLRTGDVATERVVIPEGFELKQIAYLLADRKLADRDRFIELATNANVVFGDNLPIDLPIDSLEGYLFPDTYYFNRGQSEEDLIGQMVNRFVQVVQMEIGGSIENSQFSLHEVVTLASIVEREIMVDYERPLVASVYLNRLAIDMPMQADPTVRYVMSEERSRVLYSDLEIESPYNTYRHRGLPPGPIASPGRASLEAVLNPAETDYFYFVSKGDGTHQFSRTFNEHVRARRMLGY